MAVQTLNKKKTIAAINLLLSHFQGFPVLLSWTASLSRTCGYVQGPYATALCDSSSTDDRCNTLRGAKWSPGCAVWESSSGSSKRISALNRRDYWEIQKPQDRNAVQQAKGLQVRLKQWSQSQWHQGCKTQTLEAMQLHRGQWSEGPVQMRLYIVALMMPQKTYK